MRRIQIKGRTRWKNGNWINRKGNQRKRMERKCHMNEKRRWRKESGDDGERN